MVKIKINGGRLGVDAFFETTENQTIQIYAVYENDILEENNFKTISALEYRLEQALKDYIPERSANPIVAIIRNIFQGYKENSLTVELTLSKIYEGKRKESIFVSMIDGEFNSYRRTENSVEFFCASDLKPFAKFQSAGAASLISLETAKLSLAEIEEFLNQNKKTNDTKERRHIKGV